MPHSDDGLFFADGDLRAYLEDRRARAISDIERYDGNGLLNSNVDELAAYFVSKFEVDAPAVLDDGIAADQNETKVDVSGRFDYGGWPGERVIIPGTEFTLHVPISGEIEVIRLRAPTFSLNPPRGRISGNEVILTYSSPQADAGSARRYFDEQLAKLRQYLGWTVVELERFNSDLSGAVRDAIDGRRRRLLASQNAVASLGYPLRTRPDAPRTYAVPDVKRKAIPVAPPSNTAPFTPEPALSNEVYEQILSVLGNMVRVMEQSPEAFSSLGEQDLRTHFLVQLNGQFEGRASGETFHGSGRTDILLQERDRSVFIAECKFWDGPASLTAAIDQLLDYATWRDAKAALLLFSRNADFSAVVQQVPETIKAHSRSRGAVTTLGETVFRSQLKQRDDSVREITVTTLVYNVPADRKTSDRLRPRIGRDVG